jgi:hypothetical protein
MKVTLKTPSSWRSVGSSDSPLLKLLGDKAIWHALRTRMILHPESLTWKVSVLTATDRVPVPLSRVNRYWGVFMLTWPRAQAHKGHKK